MGVDGLMSGSSAVVGKVSCGDSRSCCAGLLIATIHAALACLIKDSAEQFGNTTHMLSRCTWNMHELPGLQHVLAGDARLHVVTTHTAAARADWLTKGITWLQSLGHRGVILDATAWWATVI